MATIPAQVSTANWPLFPRKVKFEWSKSPLHWIPQSPFASHVVNQFGFSLVRGEYFFCRMFNKALPWIWDEKLKKDLETFIRQEAIEYNEVDAGHWGILSQPEQVTGHITRFVRQHF